MMNSDYAKGVLKPSFLFCFFVFLNTAVVIHLCVSDSFLSAGELGRHCTTTKIQTFPVWLPPPPP